LDGSISDEILFHFSSILGAGIAVLMIPFGKSWYIIGTAAGMYGLCLGCWYVLVPVLLADLFGTERIGSSYGLIRMFQSIGAITVPPLAGKKTDTLIFK
jgi:MFS family permease